MPRHFPRAFRPAVLAGVLLCGACQGAPEEHRAPERDAPPAGPAPEEERPPAAASLDPVYAALEAGDRNDALNLLDGWLQARPDDAAAWTLYGWTSLDFADELAASGQGGGGIVPGLQADAEAAFRRAADLLPEAPGPRAGLARALRVQGDPEGAWEAAAAAAEHMPAEGGEARLWEEIGRAGLAAVIAAVTAGEPVPDAARAAERALRRAMAPENPGPALPLSDLLAWQGMQAEARKVLVRALEDQPDWPEAFARLKNLAADPGQRAADLELARSRTGGNATVLWYLGEARYDQNLALRRAGDYPAAHEALDRAEESFILAMNQQPDFADSCRAWLHLVRTARGWTLREEGRTDEAGAAFLAALEADPQRLEAAADPGTLKLGIYAIVDDQFKAGALEMVRAFLKRVADVVDSNPDWMNNLGFACRELGVAAVKAGDQEEAATLFQESWAAYTRTVELSPDDPRLVNDRALIAVYYLDAHWDLAEAELHRAVELGKAALGRLPEDATEDERQALEEAVGDAWENLAHLDVVRRKRFDRAAGYLEESVRYYPYQQRRGVARLRGILAEAQAPAPSD